MALPNCALRSCLLAPQFGTDITRWHPDSPFRCRSRRPQLIAALRWRNRRISKAQAQAQNGVDGSEQEKESEGVATVTVAIVAPEPSTAAIEAVVAAADSSAVGGRRAGHV